MNKLNLIYHKLRKVILPPVFIFQMGKVGSTSLYGTLLAHYGGLVVHAHSLELMSTKHRMVLQCRLRCKLPILVICPVRDPFARNISAFFQNFTRDTGFDLNDHDWNMEQLNDLFLNNSLHTVCLEWFDGHFLPTFNFDIYSMCFSFSRKWRIYHRGSSKFLIYRTDLDKKEQLKVISKFLKVDIAKWSLANLSEQKNYHLKYNQFLDSVRLPDIYITMICNSRFIKHFWSEQEIVDIAKHWTQGKVGKWENITLLGRKDRRFVLSQQYR